MREKVPNLKRALEKCCREFVTCQDPERRRRLEIEIRGIDTQLRVAAKGPALIIGVIHHYYGAGLDSVAVGEELKIQAMSVRQTLWRLHKTWKALVDGTDKTPKPEEVRLASVREYSRRWRAEHPEEYEQRKAKVQEHRAANREAFRKQCRDWMKTNREYRRQLRRLKEGITSVT